MLAEIMSRANLTIFPMVSLVLFVAIYIVAVYWVMHPKRKQVNEQIAQKILED